MSIFTKVTDKFKKTTDSDFLDLLPVEEIRKIFLQQEHVIAVELYAFFVEQWKMAVVKGLVINKESIASAVNYLLATAHVNDRDIIDIAAEMMHFDKQIREIVVYTLRMKTVVLFDLHEQKNDAPVFDDIEVVLRKYGDEFPYMAKPSVFQRQVEEFNKKFGIKSS
jgi:hypothetical protein